MRRFLVRLTLLCSPLILVGCGSSGGSAGSNGVDIESRLEAHVEELRAGGDPDLAQYGAVTDVECDELGETYKGAEAFACDVTYEKGAIATWCVAFADETLHTQDSDPDIPCIDGSTPAPVTDPP